MDTRTRPKRRKRVIVEPYEKVSFYLPVDAMEHIRIMAEGSHRSYSDIVEEALRFFLAAKIHIPDMNIPTNGTAND